MNTAIATGYPLGLVRPNAMPRSSGRRTASADGPPATARAVIARIPSHIRYAPQTRPSTSKASGPSVREPMMAVIASVDHSTSPARWPMMNHAAGRRPCAAPIPSSERNAGPGASVLEAAAAAAPASSGRLPLSPRGAARRSSPEPAARCRGPGSPRRPSGRLAMTVPAMGLGDPCFGLLPLSPTGR